MKVVGYSLAVLSLIACFYGFGVAGFFGIVVGVFLYFEGLKYEIISEFRKSNSPPTTSAQK